ncbi:hypothetical protein B0H14DRAFT_3177687 [Mycena olivaceomarginata]|nr:hypothetical protein B0H14DRAFT_3177687 [Mycena olivaceomarginata]
MAPGLASKGSHKLEFPLPTAAQQSEHIHLAGGIVELCASLGAGYNEEDLLGGAFTTNPASVFEAGLEKELLNHVNLLAGVRLGLWAIEDAPGKKRPAPFPLLIKLVIYASLTGSLSLREIYAEFRDRFPWCRNPHDNKWKESIRHCLSRDNSFVNIDRKSNAVGRRGRWSLSEGAC